MPNDGSSPEFHIVSRTQEAEHLFHYGANKKLNLTSKGIDSAGRLWGRGTFDQVDNQAINVAGFLASVDDPANKQILGVMVFGWAITEVNGQGLSEPKYLLSDVAEINPEDRRRILSKAAYVEAMKKLAKKCGKGELSNVPEMKIFRLPP